MNRTTARRPAFGTPSVGNSTREETYRFDYEDDHDGELVLPAEGGHGGPDNLEEKVQTTQNRLAQLRAEAEALEREKQQFEELSRRQREFMDGRTEMTAKLGRATTNLEREAYEAQKRVEQLLVIKDTFDRHLELIESLHPEQWDPKDLPYDLGRAVEVIEDAREEYAKAMARVQTLAGAPVAVAPATPAAAGPSRAADSSPMLAAPGPMTREEFRRWVLCGAAFTLPLAALGLLYVIVRVCLG